MIEVNLYPQGAKKRRRGAGWRPSLKLPGFLAGGATGRDRWIVAAIIVPILAILVVGALFMTERSAGRALEADLEDATADSARLADLRALSDSLQRRNAENRERIALVRDLDENRFVWPHILDEIGDALPDYTWLTSIRTNNPLPNLKIQLEGLAANPLAITAFVRRLQTSPYFSDVQILGSQQQQIEQVEAQGFTLMLTYAAQPDSMTRRVPIVVGGS